MDTITFVDSIGICILNKNIIITGVGNELHLHTAYQTSELPFKLSGKIHGIESGNGVNEDKIIVYGEKEFMLIQQYSQHEFKLLYRAKLSDWISSAKFLDDAQEFILLTAHSVLLRLAYVRDEKDTVVTIIEKSSCIDKSTLYCSHIHGQHWHELVLFGGNAFGELLIWQPTTSGMSKAPLLQRLSLHNGVIFSIDYNKDAQLLITTSDDRSIKFSRVLQSSSDWSDTVLISMSSGYGHVARVFQGKIITHSNEQYAITVGEDSYFCVWRSSGELVYKRHHQFGAIIWNFVYDDVTQTLFTVGSTGNLLAFNLEDILENRFSWVASLPLNDFEQSEYVAKVKFLSDAMLIGVTNKNRLIFKHIKANADEKWHEILDFKRYKCTVLEVYENCIALCGHKRATLFKYDSKNEVFCKIFDDNFLNGVIRAFQFLDSDKYLLSDDLGQCVLVHTAEYIMQRDTIELPKCKERWLTSALMIDNEFLVLSNRQGHLLLYTTDSCNGSYNLVDTLKQVHGNLGATTLQLIESNVEKAFVRSAGHDGALRILCVNKLNGTMHLYSRQTVPVPWVEEVVALRTCDILLGFSDNHFVAWSRQHDFTLQVPCGGGHRCWHYTICNDDYCNDGYWIQLAFIKNKQVVMHKRKLFNEPRTPIKLPIANTWHVRPCNIAAIIEPRSHHTNDHILISAGDDNLIKIFRHHGDTRCRQLLQKAEIHTHISNVRALRAVPLSEECYLIFSGGGRAQLCVTKLHLDSKYQIEELLNFTLAPTTCRTDTQNKNHSFDPETRIMTCDVMMPSSCTDNMNEFYIYVGCSDGYLRKLQFNLKHNKITLQQELYYGRCILQVRIVADNQYVLTAATDGIINLYDLNLNSTLFKVIHHSSGVNALDCLYDNEACVLHILSGGDDQAVAYSSIQLEQDSNDSTILTTPKIIKSLILNNLHTAQVTAVCLARNGSILYAFTAGVDQNVCRLNLDKSEIIDRAIHRTCVADVKGMCLSSDGVYYLYGCGLQIFTLNQTTS